MHPLLLNWAVKHSPSCRETVRLLSDAMERRLALSQRLGLRLHLLICALCQRYLVQLRVLRRAARRYAAQGHPAGPWLPADARTRLTHALQERERS